MRSPVLVLDFDGTLTNAEAEAGPFRDGYYEDIATRTGLSIEVVQDRAAQFETAIARNPAAHGWKYNGKIVAPATVDPYLRAMAVARMLFDSAEVLKDPQEREEVLNRMYKDNYPKTQIVFKEGAGEAFRDVLGPETYVVTNSGTAPVQGKIRTLLDGHDGAENWLMTHVVGDAKKYADETAYRCGGVPEHLHISGLDRPVYLRRYLYFAALDRIRQERVVRWEEVAVVGDIFELDLALPLALGARVGLVVNEHTPEYEMRYLAEHPRARIIMEIREISGFLHS